MKLNIGAFAHAVGIVWAALYAICALLIAVAPNVTINAFGYITHADLTPIARSVSWGGFFAGLVVWYVVAAVSAGAGAWLYNRFDYASEAVSGEPKGSYGPVTGGTPGPAAHA